MELDNVVPIDADTARLLARRRVHFRWFVAFLAAAYVGVLVPTLLFTPLPPIGPFVMLAIVVVLAEHRFVLFGDETSMSASIIVVVASVFVFADSSPLAGPLLIGSLGGLYLPHLRRGSLSKAAINGASMGLAAAAAGSIGIATLDLANSPLATVGVVGLIVSVYWAVNNGVVAGYLAVANGQSFLPTTKYLLTSETDVLAWTGAACIGTIVANGEAGLGIAFIAAVTAVRLATCEPRAEWQGSPVLRHFAVRDGRLLGWLAAISILVFDGTPSRCDIGFALVVVLLAERHRTVRHRLIAIGLPITAIATLTAPWPAAAFLLAATLVLLVVRPRSEWAWSACVAAGATAWVLADQLALESLPSDRALSVLLAAMAPAVLSLVFYGARNCAIANRPDPWVFVGFVTPTRADVFALSAIGLAAATRVDPVAFLSLSTIATATCVLAERFSRLRSSQVASR